MKITPFKVESSSNFSNCLARFWMSGVSSRFTGGLLSFKTAKFAFGSRSTTNRLFLASAASVDNSRAAFLPYIRLLLPATWVLSLCGWRESNLECFTRIEIVTWRSKSNKTKTWNYQRAAASFWSVHFSLLMYSMHMYNARFETDAAFEIIVYIYI